MDASQIGEGLQDAELARLLERIEEARRELLDPTTRSRLLHTPLGSERAKIIEVADELAEEVFRILVREGKSTSFLPARDEELPLGVATELLQPEGDEVDTRGVAARHSDTRLQTGLPSAKLQKRLLQMSYDAQTFEREQGVNILYLGLGFLKWLESKEPEKPHHAPLILVPVNLTRRSANDRFRVSYSGEEISTNLSLQVRLKQENVDLPELPDAEDLSPNEYCASVQAKIADLKGWAVDSNSIVLGFFSFAKLMMYRDLDPERWPPGRGLKEHALIRGLLGEGFRRDVAPSIPDDVQVDEIVDIGSAFHVVDADSSQTLAIEEVQRGRSIVVQGPPGTGKSQTITNLVAAAARTGKRVLFVAEKMAALDVVHRNLERIGLGPLCLELHSHKAKKREVLEELRTTYAASQPRVASAQEVVDRLRATRDQLNAHAKRMHTALSPSMLTPFKVFGEYSRLAGRGVKPPEFKLPAARQWRADEIDERRRLVRRLADHVVQMGLPSAHPWCGVSLNVALPQDAARFASRASALNESVTALQQRAEALAARCSSNAESWLALRRLVALGQQLATAPEFDPASMANSIWTTRRAEITRLVEHGAAFDRARRRLKSVLQPDAWEQDLESLRRTFVAHGQKLLRWLRADYRAAVARFRSVHIGKPPRSVAYRMELLSVLAHGQAVREQVRDGGNVGAAAFGVCWKGQDSDWELVTRTDAWEAQARASDLPPGWSGHLVSVGDYSKFAADAAQLGAEADDLRRRLEQLFADLALDLVAAFGVHRIDDVTLSELCKCLVTYGRTSGKLAEWVTWRLWSRDAIDAGLGQLVDGLFSGRTEGTAAVDQFRYAVLEAVARQVFEEFPDLARFDGRAHDQIQNEFRQLDHDRLKLARSEAASQHIAGMPKGDRQVGEVGILAREWNKQRRHLPLRQLVSAAGRAMQAIKPVWMMSPMSLAQFVEPGSLTFDIVIMDEASQVRPVDALGAVARGTQLVVVGDAKQLPPTSFFERVVVENDDLVDPDQVQAADMASILDLCCAQGVPDRMLRWHYRSRHESLIAISNLEFYAGRLFVVPSAEREGLGLRFRRVQGIYDRGGTKTNREEALSVAQAVIAHARRYATPARFPEGMSLGVGTFSIPQRDAILDELEVLRRQNPDVEPFFDQSTAEPFFVKNLESIQGDERDIVFISVGYGPDVDGYTAMFFGPLSYDGGERRLNVLISRARQRCEVFSSISAADIDLARGRSFGVAVLKSFLHYAETGQLERPRPGVREADSDFEIDVGSTLTRMGYVIEQQVGVAGFFVDLAVKDPESPGRYLLGIECDGATYHSSRSARDRDRIREEVLRDRGWRIHRIWSADWFRRRQDELRRVVEAIESARRIGSRSEPSDPQPSGATKVPEPGPPSEPEAAEPATGQIESLHSELPPYQEADFSEATKVEPHKVPLSRRIDIVCRIVAVEGPVHEDEIARRYATVCGSERTGARIQAAVKEALHRALLAGKLVSDGPFYSIGGMKSVSPRDRSAARTQTVRQPEMLPPVEIRTGIAQVVADHIGVAPEDAIVEVARMLGFQRTGTELHRVIEGQLRAMLADGVLALRNENKLYVQRTS